MQTLFYILDLHLWNIKYYIVYVSIIKNNKHTLSRILRNSAYTLKEINDWHVYLFKDRVDVMSIK